MWKGNGGMGVSGEWGLAVNEGEGGRGDGNSDFWVGYGEARLKTVIIYKLIIILLHYIWCDV